MSYLFAFSYCSWGSQGKNTEVVCHSLLQWTMFCQNSPPWSRGTRDQILNICWTMEKASSSASLTTLKHLTVWITTSCGKILKRWKWQTTLPASWEICMQVKKQQLELTWNDRLVPIGTKSKSGKEYVKDVYCHLAYLASMQSASCKMLGWMKHKL